MKRNRMIVLLSTITIATTIVACQNTQAQTQEAATSQGQAQQSPPAKPGGEGFGGSDQVTQGEATTNLTTDTTLTGETYESTGDDENALRVTGATVTLDGVTINKTAGATIEHRKRRLLRNERRILSNRWSNGNDHKRNRKYNCTKRERGVQLRIRNNRQCIRHNHHNNKR